MHIESATAIELAAVEHCLARVEADDPLSIPVDFDPADRARALVAVADDAVIGVGWRRHFDGAATIEVRVRPDHRRQGVGASLYAALAASEVPLFANCDAAQRSVRRFLETRGFDVLGVVFLQRWDGALDDVPQAFRTARLERPADAAAAHALLETASAGTWPPPLFSRERLIDKTTRIRVARLDDHPVGLIAARLIDDAWTVGGLAVLPAVRGRGIGRGLLVDLMRQAAAEGMGVMVRAGHTDERLLNWTRALGFWTCRSFVCYRRPADRA
ncbi:MAG: GNAT family N-acetyltransferase [Myxococcales bacterium]|nr:GNAT family N-acetyltransferase [Myxococcales bacterium]